MIEYLFKVLVCSFLFLGFYLLLLQKERMFRFNRFYLLLTLILSVCIPLFLITLPQKEIPVSETGKTIIHETGILPVTETVQDSQNYLVKPENQNIKEKLIQKEENSVKQEDLKANDLKNSYDFGNRLNWSYLLTGVYFLVAVILLLKFFLNFSVIFLKISKSRKVGYQGIFLIINDHKEQLHSFWNYVFIPRENLKDNLSRKELLKHEMAHIRQKHSLDILLVELIRTLFWFNPAFYFYKKAIQLNHEFLADEAVLKTETDVYEYKKLILNSIQVRQTIPFTSNFNYILTKKRLLMMTQKTNSVKIFLLQILNIPFLLTMIFAFSTKVYAQEKNESGQLTKEQAEELRKALKLEDISHYLKDTLDSTKNYTDTLSIGNKTYIVSTSKKDLEKIFKKKENIELKNLPQQDFNQIFKSMKPTELEKTFGIKELNETDIKKLSELGNNRIIIISNNPEYKAQVETAQKRNKEIITYYNSSEWKEQENKIKKQAEETARYYNSPEFKKKIEDEVNKAKLQAKDVKEIAAKAKENAEIAQQQAKEQASSIEYSYSYSYGDDMEEFKESMKKLKEDMKALKKELKNIGKDL